jgi:hypothetical protein
MSVFTLSEHSANLKFREFNIRVEINVSVDARVLSRGTNQ